jgi:hypothetical protein
MSKCAVKRGIITLRDCGSEAANSCVICSRPMCQEHTRIRGSDLLCVECFAKDAEQQKAAATTSASQKQTRPQQTRQESNWEDESWPYYYRHHYYTTYHYSPFYSGSYYGSYYNDYDVRSFDQGGMDSMDPEETAGGFYDS